MVWLCINSYLSSSISRVFLTFFASPCRDDCVNVSLECDMRTEYGYDLYLRLISPINSRHYSHNLRLFSNRLGSSVVLMPTRSSPRSAKMRKDSRHDFHCGQLRSICKGKPTPSPTFTSPQYHYLLEITLWRLHVSDRYKLQGLRIPLPLRWAQIN